MTNDLIAHARAAKGFMPEAEGDYLVDVASERAKYQSLVKASGAKVD